MCLCRLFKLDYENKIFIVVLWTNEIFVQIFVRSSLNESNAVKNNFGNFNFNTLYLEN